MALSHQRRLGSPGKSLAVVASHQRTWGWEKTSSRRRKEGSLLWTYVTTYSSQLAVRPA